MSHLAWANFRTIAVIAVSALGTSCGGRDPLKPGNGAADDPRPRIIVSYEGRGRYADRSQYIGIVRLMDGAHEVLDVEHHHPVGDLLGTEVHLPGAANLVIKAEFRDASGGIVGAATLPFSVEMVHDYTVGVVAGYVTPLRRNTAPSANQ